MNLRPGGVFWHGGFGAVSRINDGRRPGVCPVDFRGRLGTPGVNRQASPWEVTTRRKAGSVSRGALQGRRRGQRQRRGGPGPPSPRGGKEGGKKNNGARG